MSDFWRCIMQRVPNKQYPILVFKLFNEKTPNVSLAEGMLRLSKVQEKTGRLNRHWVALRPKPKAFSKPQAPLIQVDVQFIPGGIQERLFTESDELYHTHDRMVGMDPKKNAVMPLGERMVSLRAHHISNHELEYVAWALPSPFCAVRCLDLSDNDFDVSGLNVLFMALRSSFCMLTALDLSRNALGTFLASHSRFRDSMKANTSLTCLKLNRGGITDQGAEELAAALTMNQSLVWLELAQNEIGPRGAAALAKSLRVIDSKLAILNLRGNQIHDSGVVSICNVLNSNTSLKSLNIRCTSLRTLDIGSNKFGFKYCGDTEAVSKLTDCFQANSTLTSLQMNFCGLIPAEVRIIANGIAKSVSLRALDIHQETTESKNEHEQSQALIQDTLQGNFMKHLQDLRQNLKAALLDRLDCCRYVFEEDYFYTIGETHVQVTHCAPGRALYSKEDTKVVCSWSSGHFSFKIDPTRPKEPSVEHVRKRLAGLRREAATIKAMNDCLRKDMMAITRSIDTDIVDITGQIIQKASELCDDKQYSSNNGEKL
eukprot:jgi/Bigna1/137408/aug1.39_g12116